MIKTTLKIIFASPVGYTITLINSIISILFLVGTPMIYMVVLAGMPDCSIGSLNGNRQYFRHLHKTRLFPIFWLQQSELISYFKNLANISRYVQGGNSGGGQNFNLYMTRRKRKRKYNRLN